MRILSLSLPQTDGDRVILKHLPEHVRLPRPRADEDRRPRGIDSREREGHSVRRRLGRVGHACHSRRRLQSSMVGEQRACVTIWTHPQQHNVDDRAWAEQTCENMLVIKR